MNRKGFLALSSVTPFFFCLVAVFRPVAATYRRLPVRKRPADDSITRLAQAQEEAVLYFPDYVDGGGWSVQLVLSNVDSESAVAVGVEVYDPGGQPVLELFDSKLTLEIPALGSRVFRNSGTGATRRSWIKVRTRTDSVSGLLTYRHAQPGIEVGVQPIESVGRSGIRPEGFPLHHKC